MPLFSTARVRFDVGPADVGRRLTIRARDGSQDRELVGVMIRWSGTLKDGIIRLRKRDGLDDGVRVADVLAARVIAPEVSAYAMQRLCQQSWPPLEVLELDAWTLRAARGATGRANSVRVAGAPTGSLRQVLAAVVDWYGERDLLPRLQLTTPNGLEPQLEELGWSALRRSRVMTNSVSRLYNATSESRDRRDLDIEVRPEPNSEFLRMVSGYDHRTAAEIEHVMAAVRPAAFVFCRNSSGDLMGIGHAVRDGNWCGVTTVQTTPQSRRRGIATAVTAQLAGWARDEGVSQWFLQLFEDNAAAIGFYERLGFSTHHRYEYRWPAGLAQADAWPESETLSAHATETSADE